MRGSIVVLALAVTPFVVQAQQHQNRPHWTRHDMPAASRRDRDDDRKDDDKKCEDRKRGNPSENGLQHRADPRTKGNKDCDTGSNGSGGSTGGTDTPPPPPPPPAPAPAPDPAPSGFGHTSIQGSVFFDVDHDGVMGPDEVGLSGWTVQVFGPMSASAVTDGNGAYTIAGLVPGDYTVCVMAPAGWAQTAPSVGTGPTCSNSTVGIALTAPAVVGDVGYAGVDFGFVSN
jgi:hypothetical protein